MQFARVADMILVTLRIFNGFQPRLNLELAWLTNQPMLHLRGRCSVVTQLCGLLQQAYYA